MRKKYNDEVKLSSLDNVNTFGLQAGYFNIKADKIVPPDNFLPHIKYIKNCITKQKRLIITNLIPFYYNETIKLSDEESKDISCVKILFYVSDDTNYTARPSSLYNVFEPPKELCNFNFSFEIFKLTRRLFAQILCECLEKEDIYWDLKLFQGRRPLVIKT